MACKQDVRFRCYEELFYYDGVLLGLFRDQLNGDLVIGSQIGSISSFPSKTDTLYLMAKISREESDAIANSKQWSDPPNDGGWKLVHAAFQGERSRWLWDWCTDELRPITSFKKDWVPGHA